MVDFSPARWALPQSQDSRWFAISKMVGGPFDDRDFDRAMWVHMRGSHDPDTHVDRWSTTWSMISRNAGRHGRKSGMWSGFRMDYDTLDVYFGVDGRVLKAVTVQH